MVLSAHNVLDSIKLGQKSTTHSQWCEGVKLPSVELGWVIISGVQSTNKQLRGESHLPWFQH